MSVISIFAVKKWNISDAVGLRFIVAIVENTLVCVSLLWINGLTYRKFFDNGAQNVNSNFIKRYLWLIIAVHLTKVAREFLTEFADIRCIMNECEELEQSRDWFKLSFSIFFMEIEFDYGIITLAIDTYCKILDKKW